MIIIFELLPLKCRYNIHLLIQEKYFISFLMLITTIFFLLITHGLGYSITRFLKHSSLENVIIRIGIGLGILPVLGIYLDLINIPLDWRVFFLIANALPIYDGLRCRPILRSPWRCSKPSRGTIFLLVIFLCHLFVFAVGAFRYPWLEDEDPYLHATGIKYIATEKTVQVPSGEFQYINPYPPGYDILFGILHQTNPSLHATLKFFNSFIISLGLLFFYFMALAFSDNKDKALIATFILSLTPCYLSHFIWAHSLVLTLFFPALYLLLKSRSDQRYNAAAILVIAGIFLVQPTQSLKFVILIVLMITSSFWIFRKWEKEYIKILLIALMISLVWWLPVTNDIIKGRSGMAKAYDQTVATRDIIPKLFSPTTGTATQSYSFKDYFLLGEKNLINSPIGLGPILFILAGGGIFLCLNLLRRGSREEKLYSAVILSWLIFIFLGMNSQTFHLPVGLYAFRFWLIFAIPVSLLAAETLYFLSQISHKIMLAALLGVFISSGIPKIKHNSHLLWYKGGWYDSWGEIKGYHWIRNNLPLNSKVFAFTDQLLVIAYDMMADFWSPEYKKSFAKAADLNPDQLAQALKRNRYEYIIIRWKDFRIIGVDKMHALLKELSAHPAFQKIHRIDKSFFVLKVNNAG